MQYSQLIARIQADIYNNGAELITGDILQGDLLAIISALASAGAGYGGIITPGSSAPASLDQATFYLAIQPGTYSSFGVTVTEPSIVSYGGGSTLTFTVSPLGLAPAPTVVKLNTGDNPYVLVPLTGTDGMAFTVDIEGGYSGGDTEVYAQRWLVNYSESHGVTIYVTGDKVSTGMIIWTKVYEDNGDLFLVLYANTGTLDYVTMAFRDMTGDPVPGVASVASIADYTFSSDAVIIETEFQNNKVTFIGPASSNTQYPSAKAVYEALSGKQATINTVNVSVSNTTGTPSGTASVSGSTMNLSFSGIKGEKGDTGATGPQGPQGNTGSSVDYPFELANNLTTDDPTKALSAAQGVVLEGEISQLSQELNGGSSWEEVDFSQLEQVYISIGSNGKWADSSVNWGYFIPVTPGATVKITNGQITNGYYSVLQDTAHTAQTTPNYATGYSGRIVISADTQFVVPNDGYYIFCIGKTSQGVVDNTYEIGTESEGLVDRVSALEDDAEEMSEDIQSLSESVGDIQEELDGNDEGTTIPLDLSTYTEYKTYIYASTGKWIFNIDAGCVMIPVNEGDFFTLQAASDKVSMFAVLKSNAHTGGTIPDYSDTYSSYIRLDAGTTQEITIPSDGHFLYAQTKSSSSGAIDLGITQKVPVHTNGIKDEVADLDERVTALEEGTPSGTDANLSQLFESMPFAVDSDGWEIPTTAGMVYALKKAAQASQIVYNALANYPSLSSPTGASAGEHTGFPYSSTKEIRKFIGWEVSFRTFMTAVQNLYGMFYTEDISSAHGQSGYGYTYDGTNCGPFYGMVCSILTGYALGWDIPYDTDQFAYLARKGVLVKVSDQTPQGVHICDLIWYQGHTALVTGVQRDQWGNVINVQITESRGAVHSTSFTAAQFETYLHITHNAIIYRPTKVYENTYEPSEFVAVRGESTPTPYVYNYDICHYAGDYSAMRSDQPTWINYTLGNYTGMKIYKGDTLLTTITPDGSLHKVDVSSYMTGAGKYSACLTDGVNDSEATHWQIVDAGCTYEDTGAKQKITFASSNGTPWWVQVCSSRGVAYCWYKPTQEDIANGYCELDLASMIAEQYTGTPASTTYVRIMYKADYGGVVSAMVQR